MSTENSVCKLIYPLFIIHQIVDNGLGWKNKFLSQIFSNLIEIVLNEIVGSHSLSIIIRYLMLHFTNEIIEFWWRNSSTFQSATSTTSKKGWTCWVDRLPSAVCRLLSAVWCVGDPSGTTGKIWKKLPILPDKFRAVKFLQSRRPNASRYRYFNLLPLVWTTVW
jgi:hypothetical protein